MDKPRFELRTCLGSGGFGEVYLATEHTDGGLTRNVALKVLHDPLDEDSDAVRRLRDEGRLLALLAHPAILGVHAFAPVDDRLALVTEFVDGVDLAWFCTPDRRLPLRVAVLVVQHVAEALDFAWRTPNPKNDRPLHLIHRDIKPENIRLSTMGQVKLLDFGVARSTEITRRAKTAAGQVVLTPGYGAPETLSFGVTGPAVDVFALGATLYSLVTGEMFYASDDLGAHVRLASDSVDYEAHLEKRLEAIADPDIAQLLRDMLRFTHEHRPSMETIGERCDALAERIEGPTLQQWAKSAAFPEAAEHDGTLVGMHVMADGTVRHPAEPDLPGRAPVPPPSVADAPAATWIDDETDEASLRAEPTMETPPPEGLPPPPPQVGVSITPAPAPDRGADLPAPRPSPPTPPSSPAPPATQAEIAAPEPTSPSGAPVVLVGLVLAALVLGGLGVLALITAVWVI